MFWGSASLTAWMKKKNNHSLTRSDHTAWTPPSLPDSIVLLGGRSIAAKLTAEIVPGIAHKLQDAQDEKLTSLQDENLTKLRN